MNPSYDQSNSRGQQERRMKYALLQSDQTILSDSNLVTYAQTVDQ